MSYWKCIKETPASTAFNENCIYHMDDHGVLFGNNNLTFVPGSCVDGVEWIESHTDIRFERVKRPYRCIKNTGYDFTEGFIYAVDDDGFVENNGGEVFDPFGYDNAIQWLEANTGCRFEEVKDMLYKAGDRVLIVNNRPDKHWNATGDMDVWLGREMTIAEVCDGYYRMVEDDGFWCWYPEMIVGIATFGKHSLHPGDLMKTRCGNWYIYFGDGAMPGMTKKGCNSSLFVDEYCEDLMFKDGIPDFDVVMVYRPDHLNSEILSAHDEIESILYRCALVFKREDPVKITKEEAFRVLRKAYGKDVEIVSL